MRLAQRIEKCFPLDLWVMKVFAAANVTTIVSPLFMTSWSFVKWSEWIKGLHRLINLLTG